MASWPGRRTQRHLRDDVRESVHARQRTASDGGEIDVGKHCRGPGRLEAFRGPAHGDGPPCVAFAGRGGSGGSRSTRCSGSITWTAATRRWKHTLLLPGRRHRPGEGVGGGTHAMAAGGNGGIRGGAREGGGSWRRRSGEGLPGGRGNVSAGSGRAATRRWRSTRGDSTASTRKRRGLPSRGGRSRRRGGVFRRRGNGPWSWRRSGSWISTGARSRAGSGSPSPGRPSVSGSYRWNARASISPEERRRTRPLF